MVDIPQNQPFKSLHPEGNLNAGKLAQIDRLSTEALLASLLPGLKECLKTRPEGTILDGHHRIQILRQRGVDVDGLPRQIIVKDQQ
jgi:ParB-like chromosome segregation protein Spo0J